ncbi:cytosolic protein [Geobacillus thermoleovorans]|nr:cytosolic protein [Geobacillus thermoleovorans]MCG6796286.1 DUF4004 family protein [Geobacillus sp. YHL]QNU25342.1 DUF4004 family protein [Geobacillus zalihae]
MEQELISKKELLELTGISYGQLYRDITAFWPCSFA